MRKVLWRDAHRRFVLLFWGEGVLACLAAATGHCLSLQSLANIGLEFSHGRLTLANIGQQVHMLLQRRHGCVLACQKSKQQASGAFTV